MLSLFCHSPSAFSSASSMIWIKKSFCFMPFFAMTVFNLWNNSSDTCTAIVLAVPMLISPFPASLSKCSSMTCCINFCVLLSVSSISSLTFSCKSFGIFPHMFFISVIAFLLSVSLHTTYSKDAWKAIHNTYQRYRCCFAPAPSRSNNVCIAQS